MNLHRKVHGGRTDKGHGVGAAHRIVQRQTREKQCQRVLSLRKTRCTGKSSDEKVSGGHVWIEVEKAHQIVLHRQHRPSVKAEVAHVH